MSVLVASKDARRDSVGPWPGMRPPFGVWVSAEVRPSWKRRRAVEPREKAEMRGWEWVRERLDEEIDKVESRYKATQ